MNNQLNQKQLFEQKLLQIFNKRDQELIKKHPKFQIGWDHIGIPFIDPKEIIETLPENLKDEYEVLRKKYNAGTLKEDKPQDKQE